MVKALVFSGSLRTGSLNQKLADLAARELEALGAEVTRLSLRDYPLPIYDADLQAREGIPDSATRLCEVFMAHQAIYIASPEYNASVPPILKNAIDWLSRIRPAGAGPYPPFRNRAFGLGAVAGGNLGGYRGLMALRQVLTLTIGALVVPEMVSVPSGPTAFAEDGGLKDERSHMLLASQCNALLLWAERAG